MRPPIQADDHEVCRLDSRHHPEGDSTGYSASFDAGKLHQQLADLLQLYLKRASDADAVKQCSAKDALACAKALTSMMTDVQSGRSASVDKNTRWPQIKSWSGGLQAPDRVRRADQRRSCGGDCTNTSKSRAGESACTFGGADKPGLLGGEPHPTESSRYSILEDALASVLASDEESSIPEPHLRFIARADRLCKEVRQRLPNSRSGGLQAATPSIARPGDLHAWACRASGSFAGGTGACPPKRARHAVPSNEGDKASVVQPRPGGQAFRAGFSEEKTRAKALDYREKRQSSRAGEPPARHSRCGDGAPGGGLEDGPLVPLTASANPNPSPPLKTSRQSTRCDNISCSATNSASRPNAASGGLKRRKRGRSLYTLGTSFCSGRCFSPTASCILHPARARCASRAPPTP